MAEEWISAEQACTSLRVGYMTLVRWVDDGTLVAEGVDGVFLFRRSDKTAWRPTVSADALQATSGA